MSHSTDASEVKDSRLYSVFSKIAVAEGVSYLLLVFVAMPLKYGADIPEAVKYTGWAHGVLFVAFCAFLPFLLYFDRWRFKRAIRAFILSLIPFGTFRKL